MSDKEKQQPSVPVHETSEFGKMLQMSDAIPQEKEGAGDNKSLSVRKVNICLSEEDLRN